MLKWIAALMNVGVLGSVVIMIFSDGFPNRNNGWFGLFLVIVIPTVNLWYILSVAARAQSDDDENILSLWLRVKKSELRKRLD